MLQSGRLRPGSVLENVIGSSEWTLDDAWEAAGLAKDLERLPSGMDTVIGRDGSGLSGGQRQRFLIARALVCRPRILLFDEATSALDNRARALVSESLERLRVTRVVITHRLSTVRTAGRIYVIDAGRLVESGTRSCCSGEDCSRSWRKSSWRRRLGPPSRGRRRVPCCVQNPGPYLRLPYRRCWGALYRKMCPEERTR